MHQRFVDIDWQKALWRILKNPALEVVAAILVVMLAAWVVVETEVERRTTLFPLVSGHR
jgi:ABC-type nickel/cobalt efflux system permease component RcnA